MVSSTNVTERNGKIIFEALVNSKSQLDSLVEKASILTKLGMQYRQSLEKRCPDLKMAEAEVDLLGNELEELLSLLAKIYIAVDHYTPVLQHYPGIWDKGELNFD
ncbi:hypothetical protein POM88_035181 [Heracleum sosnowskyi]|uniref:Uncharacterized protein n=1 Tax=Heracleum sosnowskyi TaxID=360622 RepID=A0AAD8HMJ9_9APIA|nr:hypothetical protein POM88_035181 [Heracleum sosnowskyi]